MNTIVTENNSNGSDGNSNNGGYDVFLIKYNSAGVKQWSKQLGTSSELGVVFANDFEDSFKKGSMINVKFLIL